MVFTILNLCHHRAFDTGNEILYEDQIRLSESLPFPLNQTTFLFKLIQKLRGFLVGTVHVCHDLFDGVDDIHPPFFISPLVLDGQIQLIEHDAVQDFGFRRQLLKLLPCKKHFGNPVEGKLFRLGSVEIIKQASSPPLFRRTRPA